MGSITILGASLPSSVFSKQCARPCARGGGSGRSAPARRGAAAGASAGRRAPGARADAPRGSSAAPRARPRSNCALGPHQAHVAVQRRHRDGLGAAAVGEGPRAQPRAPGPARAGCPGHPRPGSGQRLHLCELRRAGGGGGGVGRRRGAGDASTGATRLRGPDNRWCGRGAARRWELGGRGGGGVFSVSTQSRSVAREVVVGAVMGCGLCRFCRAAAPELISRPTPLLRPPITAEGARRRGLGQHVLHLRRGAWQQGLLVSREGPTRGRSSSGGARMRARGTAAQPHLLQRVDGQRRVGGQARQLLELQAVPLRAWVQQGSLSSPSTQHPVTCRAPAASSHMPTQLEGG
jgi:hypothetical protein